MHLVNIDRDKLVAAAAGDPWLVNATLQHGRPAQIDILAQAFHHAGQAATAADNAFARARERFEKAWIRGSDEHPINNSSPVQLAINSLGVQAARLPDIAVALEDIAATLAEAQRVSITCIEKLENSLEDIDRDLGSLRDVGNAPHAAASEQSLEHEATSNTTATWQQIVHIRDGYTGVLRDAEGKLRADGYDPALVKTLDQPPFPIPDQPALPIPSSDAGPAVVHTWWTALSPDQKTRLIAQHSPDLGNLNGIPADVRDEVNRAVLTDDLNRVHDLATLRGVSAADVLTDPGRYGLTAADATRYTNARHTEQGLAASADAVNERNEHPDVLLWRYEPAAFGGDGAAAIAMGDPDTAVNTAVLVKGLGSGVKQGTLANADGVRLYNEANRADWGNDTAVVMWLGYDAPDSAVDPGLYEPNMARTGGQSLAADVNAFAVTHHGPATHMTVVGHSYGSTTVADAAAGFGMHADDVVLVGCPGTDLARSAADFHLAPGGHLYVGDASLDRVSWFGEDTVKTPFGGVGLGQDPAMDGYGSVRFKAEVPGYSFNPFYDHSHYFDLGSESLFSIGDVVSGHGDALARDGMTARHRGEYGLPAFVEPEAGRPPTTGHRHTAPAG